MRDRLAKDDPSNLIQLLSKWIVYTNEVICQKVCRITVTTVLIQESFQCMYSMFNSYLSYFLYYKLKFYLHNRKRTYLLNVLNLH